MSGKLAAGIVAFRSNPDLLLPLVRRLAAETDALFVFVNGPIEDQTLEALRGTTAVVVESQYNLGVGEALNQLALHAIVAGCSRLAVFDDDSGLPADAVAKLWRTMDALEGAGEKPAVVGPKIVSPIAAPETYRPPRYFDVRGKAHGAARGVLYVITSGSLINLDVFRRVGRFRSDFFIDAIDTEWCFRVWHSGHSCWVDDSVEMEHRIGAGVTRRTILGRGFPKQPPMRLYAYVRNQVHCLRLPHLPLWWRALLSAHLVRLCGAYWLGAENKREMRRLLCDALRDGMAGRLGPPALARNVARLNVSA